MLKGGDLINLAQDRDLVKTNIKPQINNKVNTQINK
jgi:hypothetical protein